MHTIFTIEQKIVRYIVIIIIINNIIIMLIKTYPNQHERSLDSNLIGFNTFFRTFSNIFSYYIEF